MRSILLSGIGLSPPPGSRSMYSALKILLCSGVMMLLQATGPEDLIEQRCGGSLPSGWGKELECAWSDGDHVLRRLFR